MFDHGSAKIGDKTFGFLIVLDGATSHLTAYPCKSTSPSGVIAKLHEWMNTFQMNPKAICAGAARDQRQGRKVRFVEDRLVLVRTRHKLRGERDVSTRIPHSSGPGHGSACF